MSPEKAYIGYCSIEHRKRFAQFFTPPSIAQLMSEWVMDISPATLLDPSVGTGILVRHARHMDPCLFITAVEKDPLVRQAFESLNQPGMYNELIDGDFLTTEFENTFDAILMNPPYIRHQELNYGKNIFLDFSEKYQVKISALSNIYVLFIFKAVGLLNPGGRASIIVPSEWMNSNYGMALKEFLIGKTRSLKEIVYFNQEDNVFDDALTSAAILFLEKPL